MVEKRQEPITHKTELAHIAEGAGTVFVGRILDGGFRYIYALMVAKILGPKSFGIFMLGFTIISFAAMISRLGLDSGVIRYVSIYNGLDDKKRVKGTIVQALIWSFMAGVLVAVVLFAGATFLSVRVFNKPELRRVITVLSFSLPFLSTMMVAQACTQGLKIMKYAVCSRRIFWPLSNIVLAILSCIVGLGLIGIVVANAASNFLTCVLSFLFLLKCFANTRSVKAVCETGKLFRFSIPVLAVNFLAFLIMWTDTLMLGYFKTSFDVGVYNAVTRTALLISVILASFSAIFAPIVSDIYYKKDMQLLSKLFKAVTRWNFVIGFPVSLLIIIFSKTLITIFGQEFVAGYIPLMILAFSQLVNVSTGSVGVVLVMSGRQNLMMYNTIGICLLNIFLNYLLIPSYGIIGASLASGISIIISNIVMLLEVLILLKIHPYSLQFLKSVVSGIVAFGVLLLVHHMGGDLNPVLRISISVLLFTAVFLWLLQKCGFNSEDKFVFRFIKKKIVNLEHLTK